MTSARRPEPGGERPDGESREERWGRRLLLLLIGIFLIAAMFQTAFRPGTAVRRPRVTGQLLAPLPSTPAPGGETARDGPSSAGPLARDHSAGAPAAVGTRATSRAVVFPDGVKPELAAEALRLLEMPAEITTTRRGADLVLRGTPPRAGDSTASRPLFGYESSAEVPTVLVPAGTGATELADGLVGYFAGSSGLRLGGVGLIPLRTAAVHRGYLESDETPGAPGVRRRGAVDRDTYWFPLAVSDGRDPSSLTLFADGVWELRLLPAVVVLDAGTCVTFDLQARVSYDNWVSISGRPEVVFRIVGDEPHLEPHRSAANRFCLPAAAPFAANGRRVTIEADFMPPDRPTVTRRATVILRVQP